MKWFLVEAEKQNIEDYQNYLITKEIKGKMTPTRDGAIRLINSKRSEKIMKFETVVGLCILALLVIVGGLGNYFIDGLGV